MGDQIENTVHNVYMLMFESYHLESNVYCKIFSTRLLYNNFEDVLLSVATKMPREMPCI